MSLFLATLALASTLVPINDLGANHYMWGYYGGLWENDLTYVEAAATRGSNVMPADHAAGGLRQAARIEPLDVNGFPAPNGKIGFVSVGYGNTARTFEEFTSLAASDGRVNHSSVVMLNGAAPHLDATKWEQPWQPVYSYLYNDVLAPAGISEQQVQVVWLQQINENPYTPLPIQYADTYILKASIANNLRALKTHFPNLQIAYLSSPEYSGYDAIHFLGEPFAYEDGFAVRWIISGQILFQRDGELWDPRIANLSYDQGVAPWVTWGPYLWADGENPRSDGLTWLRDDFESDGATLSQKGARKSATELLKFMLREPTASNWFRTRADIPSRSRAVHH